MDLEEYSQSWWLLRDAMSLGSPAFVFEAKQELVRLIDDVQKNRNRPEDLP